MIKIKQSILMNSFFVGSSSPSLSLRIDVGIRGFWYTILEAVIPNSSIQPGFTYTAKYGIV
jgi:hypothetical protein